MAHLDYYETLEITESASSDEVRKAYRKLALKFHPDKNSTPDAAEKFKEISHAYEILSDPERRQTYDHERRYGHANAEEDLYGHFGGGFHFHSPDEIFAQFFGGQQMGAFGFPGFGFGFGQGGSRDPFSRGTPRGRRARDPFGGSPFDDPFFSGGHRMHDPHASNDPFLSGVFGMQSMLGGGMGSSASFSSSSSSSFGGGGGGTSRSVSRSTRIVNGHAQTVTVTKVQDANGTTVTEDYGDGRTRTTVNGVEQHNTLESGHRPGPTHYISEGPDEHSATRHQHRAEPYPINVRRRKHN